MGSVSLWISGQQTSLPGWATPPGQLRYSLRCGETRGRWQALLFSDAAAPCGRQTPWLEDEPESAATAPSWRAAAQPDLMVPHALQETYACRCVRLCPGGHSSCRVGVRPTGAPPAVLSYPYARTVLAAGGQFNGHTFSGVCPPSRGHVRGCLGTWKQMAGRTLWREQVSGVRVDRWKQRNPAQGMPSAASGQNTHALRTPASGRSDPNQWLARVLAGGCLAEAQHLSRRVHLLNFLGEIGLAAGRRLRLPCLVLKALRKAVAVLQCCGFSCLMCTCKREAAGCGRVCHEMLVPARTLALAHRMPA